MLRFFMHVSFIGALVLILAPSIIAMIYAFNSDGSNSLKAGIFLGGLAISSIFIAPWWMLYEDVRTELFPTERNQK